MADSRLKIDIRRDKILEHLREEGKVRVSDLSRELGASVVTIRTDLDSLEQDGYLERVQGGAIQKARVNADWLEMESRQDAEKRRIAEEAARHLKDGSTLFINSGTTTRHLAVALKQHKSLNVVTNSLAVSMELGNIPSIHVILLGGEINTQYAFTYWEDAREQLKHYQADWAVLSIDGISDPAGVTTFHAEEAVVDRMMMERARKTMIIADYTKVGRAGFTCLHRLDGTLELVTDSQCDREQVRKLEARGVRVTVAESQT